MSNQQFKDLLFFAGFQAKKESDDQIMKAAEKPFKKFLQLKTIEFSILLKIPYSTAK